MDTTSGPALYTLEGVAALEKRVADTLIVALPEATPAGAKLVAFPPNYSVKEYPPVEPVLASQIKSVVTILEPDSFAAYVNRFQGPEAVAFASLSGLAITARLNYHAAAASGGDAKPAQDSHASTLKLALSEDWKSWCAAIDGDPMTQEQFSDFVDDMAHTIATPALADLKEAALSVSIERSIKFRSKKNLTNGTVQMAYDEIDAEGATVGSGSLALPNQIGVVLPVFEGGEPESLLVALKYQLLRGHIVLSLALPGRVTVIRNAFRKVGDGVVAATQLPLFYTA